MSTAAAGAYLRTLREEWKLSRAAVATQAGTHESQLVRIEAGEQDSRGSLLFAIARIVRADLETLADLMTDPNATVEHGKQRGVARIAALREMPAQSPEQIATLTQLLARVEALEAQINDRHQEIAQQLRESSAGDEAPASDVIPPRPQPRPS